MNIELPYPVGTKLKNQENNIDVLQAYIIQRDGILVVMRLSKNMQLQTIKLDELKNWEYIEALNVEKSKEAENLVRTIQK